MQGCKISFSFRYLSPFQARGGGLETVTFTRPLDSRLEHVDFSLLFLSLPPRKIIQVFSSMLMERRIILCSSNLRSVFSSNLSVNSGDTLVNFSKLLYSLLSLLTGCAHALLALLYPFEWQVCLHNIHLIIHTHTHTHTHTARLYTGVAWCPHRLLLFSAPLSHGYEPNPHTSSGRDGYHGGGTPSNT